jgi:hypothetical protein
VDSGSENVGPFDNFGPPFPDTLARPYWSGTQSINDPNTAWYFDFYYGNLNPGDITGTLDNQFYAWAVRDGDVAPIPEPGTILLLASGLVGLIGLKRKYLG